MIGEELRKRRDKMGLTQVELGGALGVHPNTIAKWERGDQSVRMPGMLRYMLIALDRDLVAHGGSRDERAAFAAGWLDRHAPDDEAMGPY